MSKRYAFRPVYDEAVLDGFGGSLCEDLCTSLLKDQRASDRAQVSLLVSLLRRAEDAEGPALSFEELDRRIYRIKTVDMSPAEEAKYRQQLEEFDRHYFAKRKSN